MAPIEGLSDIIRLPRLGKIRLGEKLERPGKPTIPKALDYFKCPPEVQEVYGQKPKELDIMFPTEDPNQFAQQWLRSYSQTQGLLCVGDGRTCRRKVDTETGDMAGRDTKRWVWKDGLPCNPGGCAHYGKRCKRVMNLQFILPKFTKGFGVWQIDTSSFYSIVNINSAIDLVARAAGRISFIRLPLCLGPQEVSPPGEKKKIVYCLYIDMRQVSLAQLLEYRKGPPRLTTPEPEVEEAPEDLWAEGGESETGELVAHWKEVPTGEEGEGAEREGERDKALGVEEGQRLAVWKAINELKPQVKVMTKTERSYFAEVHHTSVSVEELEKDTPPVGLTLQMLTEFKNWLEASRPSRLL